MTDHDALLRAVCENPREDTPRLVYADWLEENGQPDRAAFIRRDIAMSLLDEWDADRLRWEGGLTHEQLSARPWAAGLFPDLPARCNWNGPPITRRGFTWSIRVEQSDTIFSSTPDLLTRHPVQRLYFAHRPPDARQILRLRGADRLAGFAFGGVLPGRALDPILAGAFPDIEELGFWSGGVTPDQVAALFASSAVGRMSTLGFALSAGLVGQVLAEGLAGPGPARLRSLTLRASFGGEDGIARLVNLRLPGSVRCLDLSNNHINTQRMSRMAASSALAGIRVLTLRSNLLGNVGAAAVFNSPQFTGLKVLDLSYCFVGDDALRVLLDNSPLADGLNFLDLTGSPASADMKLAVKERMGDRVRL